MIHEKVVVLVVISQLVLSCSAASTSQTALSPDADDLKISQLEAERAELLQQIKQKLSEAAQEPSAAGLAQEISDRLDESSGPRVIGDSPQSSILSGRRAEKKTLSKDDRLFALENMYSKKERQSKKWKGRMKNKAIIQNKLDAWLQDRLAEKAKIKAYKDREREKNMNKEKCPRNGIRTKKKFRRDNRKYRHSKYPCCRKCCKRSYMGCL